MKLLQKAKRPLMLAGLCLLFAGAVAVFAMSNRSVLVTGIIILILIFFQAMKQFGQRIFKYYNHVEFSLFGGEPLLFAEDFIDLLQFTGQLSNDFHFTYGASLTTNGTLITYDLLDSLIEAKCKQIQVTIDGYKGSHDSTRKFSDGSGSYDRLIEIINNVMKNKIIDNAFSFILRINLLNNTVEQFESLLNDISPELKSYVQLLIRPIYSTETFDCKNENDLDHLKVFYDTAKKWVFLC